MEHVFQELGRQNQDLRQVSTQYYNTMRTNLISSLLAGSFPEDRLAEQLPVFGLDFREDMEYLVGVMEYVDTASPEQKAVDYMQLNTFCQERHLAANGRNLWSSSWWVSSLPTRAAVPCLREQTWCGTTVPPISARMWTFSAAFPKRGLGGIGRSYQEARSHSQSDILRVLYYYPIEVELQLVNQLKLGNQGAAQKIIEELREENEGRPLTGDDKRRVSTLILETLLRVASEVELNTAGARGEFDQILSSQDESWAWIIWTASSTSSARSCSVGTRLPRKSWAPSWSPMSRNIIAIPACLSSSFPACFISPVPWCPRYSRTLPKSTLLITSTYCGSRRPKLF